MRAKQLAKQVLKDHRIETAPVPVEKIAEDNDITVKHEPFEGELSGMAYRSKEGKIVIGVNSTHSQTRCRFSIAHELAHVLLHKDETLHIDEKFPLGLIGFRDKKSSLAINPQEIEANQFAAELLMPEEFLKKDLKNIPEEAKTLDEAIEYLAKLYNVSTQAMTIRLSALQLIA